jgi:hypothetical protein
MQQIFNLLINMIIIESTLINNFSEVFHLVENDNRIDLETNALFENEVNFVIANRIFINKFVNHLLVQWNNNDYENYVLWTIFHDELLRRAMIKKYIDKSIDDWEFDVY